MATPEVLHKSYAALYMSPSRLEESSIDAFAELTEVFDCIEDPWAVVGRPVSEYAGLAYQINHVEPIGTIHDAMKISRTNEGEADMERVTS